MIFSLFLSNAWGKNPIVYMYTHIFLKFLFHLILTLTVRSTLFMSFYVGKMFLRTAGAAA